MFCVASLNYLQLNLYRLTFFSARVSSFNFFFLVYIYTKVFFGEKSNLSLALALSFCCNNNYNMFCFVVCLFLFPQPNFSELTLNLYDNLDLRRKLRAAERARTNHSINITLTSNQ